MAAVLEETGEGRAKVCRGVCNPPEPSKQTGCAEVGGQAEDVITF